MFSLFNMSFVLYPDPNSDWNTGEKYHRTAQYDLHREGIERYGSKVDLSSWALANDDNYLGLCGPTYNGRMYGNDSSSMQCALNMPGFWKRISYRPKPEDVLEKHIERTQFNSLSMRGSRSLDRSSTTASSKPKKNYVPKAKQVDVTELTNQYPTFVNTRENHERINFFNTLGYKYEKRPGRACDVDKQPHSSSKAEINFMAHKWFG